MMLGIPFEAIKAIGAVMGLTVIGFIGTNIIAEMGGKTLGVMASVILTVAGTIVGLKYAFHGIKEVLAVVTGW